MRDIRFRAWDKEDKEMINADCCYLGDRDELFVDAVERMFEWCILMQYTGLKDKMGEEIFEGDIVNVISISDGVKQGVITFTRGCFWIDYQVGNSDLLYVPLKVEVIGNIYENPELLEAREIDGLATLDCECD